MKKNTFYKGLSAILAVSVTIVPVSAEDSFYGNFMLGEEFMDTRLQKFVKEPDMVGQTARDSENEEDTAFGIAFGYRFELTPRTHFKTELDFTAHKQAIRGFLFDGTGTAANDVWPGAWSVERNRSAGLTFKLGYEPEEADLLDSVYLLTGVRWLPLTGEVRGVGNDANNRSVTAVSRRDFDLRPWVMGAGAAFAAPADGRFNFELRYMEYDVDWFFSGNSDPAGTIIRHDIGVHEWGLLFGYSWELDI